MNEPLALSYVLPVRWTSERHEDLGTYLRSLSREVDEIIIVDGSPEPLYTLHRQAWGRFVTHMAPHPGAGYLNGKVNGVVTGIVAARNERVVIADDDVRYDREPLDRVAELLADADLVRPQNVFSPMPWQAVWDTARTLVNRATGRDFPGTLAIRRSTFLEAGGYDGDVLFENLELIRTVEASGGTVVSPLDLYVHRRPPDVARFLAQRVQQAYDDLAIPARFAAWLSLAPATVIAARVSPFAAAALGVGAIGIAERGRRRAGGRHVFPFRASLVAPLWFAERGITAWIALARRVSGSGFRYAGSTIGRSASRPRDIVRRTPRRRERLNRLVAEWRGNEHRWTPSNEGARSWPRREKVSPLPSSRTRS